MGKRYLTLLLVCTIILFSFVCGGFPQQKNIEKAEGIVSMVFPGSGVIMVQAGRELFTIHVKDTLNFKEEDRVEITYTIDEEENKKVYSLRKLDSPEK